MRDLQQELERCVRQEAYRLGYAIEQDQRLYGQARQRFVDGLVRTKKVGDMCETQGTAYCMFEWMAGRQEQREGVPKLDPVASWIVEDGEWLDLDRQLVHAVRNLDTQEPLGLPAELLVSIALASYDENLLADMRHWKLPDISVDRVGAHLMALGYRWSDAQLAALTRRFTIALLNHATWVGR